MSVDLYHNLPELARKGGFMLCDGAEEKDDSIDWRFIASIDTARIIRDSDFEKLDQCIPFLIRSSVGNLLNVRILDPAIARIYIISQLCLQYLLFCTKFLDKSVYSLRENVFNHQKKTLKLEESIEQKEEEIIQLQKKLKRLDSLDQQVYSCAKCTKNFLSSALLDGHILRKHPPPQQQESKDKDSNLINTIKLELEIKQLKERLNVTENELMDASRNSECQNCLENARRKFESVGVQSNFEEKEKDDIEKDAITELLNNQMKHFEEWKQNEESRYRSEITELRARLDQTIEAIQRKDEQLVAPPPPLPAPRILMKSEKCVGTSKSETTSDANIWKSRYEELEQMYKQHQKQMTSTVTSIETTYNHKFKEIEDSMKQLRKEKKKLEEVTQPMKDERNKIPLIPKIIQSKPLYQRVSSSESSDVESIPELLKAPEPEVKLIRSEKVEQTKAQSFSAQKFLIRSKPKTQRKDVSAEKLFSQRLNTLGINENDKKLNKKEFDRVQLQLADMREETKKKHKSFFLTRKKLQTKVDRIFHRKYDVAQEKDSTKKEVPQNSLFCGSVKKSKPEVSVKLKNPEVKLSNDSAKKSFRDDLERVLEKRMTPSTLNNTLEIEALPSSVSKKKVLFDLKDDENGSKIDEIVEMNEEDSDFDISSFDSELEEVKM